MARYVPKTYNNRRGLRIIVGVFATLALSVVIIFLILFFMFQNYVVDGQLVHPLLDDWNDAPPPVSDEVADEYDGENYDGYEYNGEHDGSYEYDTDYDYDYNDDYGYNDDYEAEHDDWDYDDESG
ncbi:MAG: hypothetical protein FWC20_02230 [Oscillospiraceae bacterium]|nr:hypothetical protein [Oscillospiraceae bacterium]MCL2278211.1 hypothetical protein [Oscillospiraceae bacterium]